VRSGPLRVLLQGKDKLQADKEVHE